MATLLEDLRTQHRQLETQADALGGCLVPGRVEADPAAVHRVLLDFGHLLHRHLDLEDREFYPMARRNAEAEARVAGFEAGVSRLKHTVESFLMGWPDARSLAQDPGGFRDYAWAVLRVLNRRIQAEEADLFPLFEGSPGPGTQPPESR